MEPDLSQWGLVKSLRPFKPNEVSLQDKLVRGEAWTFAHNQVTGSHMRVNSIARVVLKLLDGRKTLDELLDALPLEVSKSEKEALALSLISLSEQGMVNMSDAAHEQRLQQRSRTQAAKGKRMWHNPLAIRIPLLDPDHSLSALNRMIGPLLGARALLVVSAIIILALISAVLHRQDVANELRHIASTPQHWWFFVLLYPLFKCAHELGHALALKRWGGEVHEIGITFLVLMPIPYVDATDIWRFERRYQRILVCAAGMLTEALLAATGMMIWLNVEPGLLSELGFAAALTGSVSTLLFNANPLLKFDGYHILQDVLDIPNLAQRATRYLHYLARRYLLRVGAAVSPVAASGERKWLLSYALCAGLYRWVITLGIALYLASRFPVLGGLLALFALHQLFVNPIGRLFRYLRDAAELEGQRTRAAVTTMSWVGVCLFCFFLLPVPTNTRAQGVIGLPTQAEIYAPESGIVEEVLVEQGQRIDADQPILKLRAPELETQVKVVNAQLSVLSAQYHTAVVNDVVASRSLLQDVKQLRTQLDQHEQRLASLTVRAKVNGALSLNHLNARVGDYVKAGDPLGYVVNPDQLLVKAVVSQSDISRVREGINSVRIRLAERFSEPLEAQLSRQIPAATRVLPSQALAYNGLSGIAVASNAQNQWKTVEPVFHIELNLPASATAVGIGGRAFVTMNHRSESIGQRSWRSLRQLLLDQLAI
ncbi:MAG: HlyD family efflux transporter periplasmic adaptor subunit [Granulosicoccus sp.]